MSPALSMIIALVIFVGTYILIITEKINKMLAALIGGFLLVVTGIVHQDVAFKAIDWNVIFFLIGMMFVIAVLKRTGIFMFVAIKTAKLARGKPLYIMILMFLITALASAFLGSVTTIMILVPIILLICHELQITPVPFIVVMAVASNMGGAATMIGDPPNIIIGSATPYDFMDFILNLTPVILIVCAASVGLIWLLYAKKLRVSVQNRAKLMGFRDENLIKSKRMLLFSGIVVLAMMILLALDSTLHIGTATISMSAGLLLLLVGDVLGDKNQVEHVLINEVDWVTLFFFIGLFMIVESLVETGIIDAMANSMLAVTQNQAKPTSLSILWMSGVLSAFIDNVPFVATMIPMIEKIGTVITQSSQIDPIWWAMSLGACLGGNGTLIGASANVIAVGIAKQNNLKISYWEFTKISAIFTLLSLLISTAYILLRYF